VVVDAFVDASLLVSDHDPADPGEEAVVEVAHEALLRQWPPLREAIEADRDLLRLRSELERLAADWQHGRRDDSYLLRGGRLAAIDHWAREHPGELGALEREFVAASRELATRELEATRRSNRRLRRLAVSLAVLLVVALIAGGLAGFATLTARKQTRTAQAQTRLALSRQLAGEAEKLADRRPDTAILAGLQSLSLARDHAPKPSAGLITALGRVTHASRPLIGHNYGVFGVAFSPDGRLLATPSDDDTVQLWDVATGQPHGQPLTGHDDAVFGVAFSPDGQLLATASQDSTVRLWDVATGQPHGDPLPEPTDNAVNGVAFSPDGRLLATANGDDTVQLWDVATGQPHGQPLTGHDDAVFGVAFSPDGRLLATTSPDQTVRLWDVATGQPHGQPLTGHTDAVFGVAFSPDGQLLATASGDGTARLWNPFFNNWLSVGCHLVNRNLSMTEWAQLLPGVPYQRTCPNLPAGQDAPSHAPAAQYSN
jgi:conflict system STAND superfamily ATPase/WD40 domain-containing protein